MKEKEVLPVRDIPVFTTENGAASLILREIPYSGAAYVTIQATLSADALLEDCMGFCKAAGAKLVLATGHPALERYPVYAVIRRMSRLNTPMDTDAVAVPVTEETIDTWRDIYNRKMANVLTAAHMNCGEGKKLLDAEKAYFVYRGETCIGICAGEKDTVEVIASTSPGCGLDILSALCNIMTENEIFLDVAEENHKAIRLYEQAGFKDTGEKLCWYKIF